MSSRDYIRHLVSNTAPAGTRAGDEYYDPGSNRLYKTVVVNGTTVVNLEIPIGLAGSIPSYSVLLTTKVLIGATLTLPGNTTYTMGGNMDVYVDGVKLLRGVDYTETTNTTLTSLIAIPVGSTIEFRTVR